MESNEHDAGGYDRRTFVAEFYDFVPPYANRADRQFYVDYARNAGGPVLELGCGTGRLLIPIARSGVSITGLDLSHAMLQRCREQLAQEPPAVQASASIHHGDMTQFSLGKKFAIATVPFRAFQHLIAVEQQLACLRCIREHLVENGVVILDLFQVQGARIHDRTFMKSEIEFEGAQLPDGRSLSRSSRVAGFHRAQQINDCELIYDVTHPDGRTERLIHDFPLRYFFRYEVEHLLARSGFQVAKLFGDYDRSALTDESPEMIFVARKIPL